MATNWNRKLLVASKSGNLANLRAAIANDPARVNTARSTGTAGYTALMQAANYGRFDCLYELINQGACVDIITHYFNFTALMLAAREGHDTCVKALLAAGADIEPKDSQGRTALDFAKQAKAASCIKLLEEAAEGRRPSREEAGLKDSVQSAVERIRRKHAGSVRGV